VAGTTLAQYYGAIDDGRLDDALALLHEKVRFVIALDPAADRVAKTCAAISPAGACPTANT